MRYTSVLAIYSLFWALSLFLVLPIGMKTHDEAGAEKIPGQADSAPHNFRPLRIVLYTTILSAVLFGLYYLNYVNGWITAEDIDFFHPPAE